MTDALLWLDLETTGVDPHTDDVLEAAWAMTTMRGDLLPYTNHLYVNGDPSKCDDFVRGMHTDNGLLADLDKSARWDMPTVAMLLNAQADMAKEQLGLEAIHLAGASVHFDRSFFTVAGLSLFSLTHRHVDVSTLKLAATAVGRRYNNSKKPRHRAWWDVVEEIETYKALLKLVAK